MISFVMEIADAGFVEAYEILSNERLPELPHRLPKAWVRLAELRPRRKLSRAEREVLDVAGRIYHTMLVVAPKGPDSSYGYMLGRGLTVEAIAERVPLEFQLGYCPGGMLAPALCYLRSDPAHGEASGCSVARMVETESSSPDASPLSSGTAPDG